MNPAKIVGEFTSSKMGDILTDHIKNNYDLSQVRPNKTFVLSCDHPDVYLIFKEFGMDFKDTVRRSLITALTNYYAENISSKKPNEKNIPQSVLSIQEIVSGRMGGIKTAFKNIKIKLSMTPNIKLCKLSSDHEKIPMCFDVRVIGLYDKKSYTKELIGWCESCARLQPYRIGKSRKPPKTIKCDKCQKATTFTDDDIKTGDVQNLIIQERQEDSDNMSVEKKLARIYDDMVGTVFPGDNKRVIGIFRSVPKEKNVDNDIVIDVIDCSDLEDIKPTMPSPEELKKWKEDSKDESFFDTKIVPSFANEVKGYTIVKEALLMTIAGGVAIKKPNGKTKRGTINTFLVGDPSTAKSKLLKACKAVAHKSILTGGKGVSAVGLTAGVIKQHDGSSMVELGVFPLCDNGTAIIDEFDKMQQHDRAVMHICMEDQFVPINKGGFNLSANCRTTTIAAANPKGGKWGKTGNDIMDNVNLDEPLLTRFDTIFLFLDKIDDVKDTDIGMHILNSWTDEETPDDLVYMQPDEMKRYLNYVKQLRPKLSEQAKVTILKFFKKIRNMTDSQDSIPIAFRQLDGLTRLSMARAKMMFHEEVNERDVEIAINIYKHMLETFGIDLESGKVQEIFGSPKEIKKEESFWKVWEECQDPNGNVLESTFLEELPTNKVSSKFFDEDKANREWKEKIKHLLILRNSDGTYRRG